MGTGRWRIEIVEQTDRLPVVWHPPVRSREVRQAPNDMTKTALMSAFQLLSNRGVGPSAWAASFYHDPIAFLLDTSSDAVNLWGSRGELLYRNRAAERLGLGRCEGKAWEVFTAGNRRLERRCCRFRYGNARYLLEIIGERADSVAVTDRDEVQQNASARWHTSPTERR